jgi:uncharacterized membrane protein
MQRTLLMILPLHILGGMLALVFGYIALFAAKGGRVHRKAGMYFVYAMVVMALGGAFIAAINSTTTSVIAGLLTFYFATTGMLTVRRAPTPRWIDRLGIAIALVVGVMAFAAGREMSLRGRPEAAPMFIFGGMAMLGVIGDVRMLRAGGIDGRPRIKRHLWRMCFAMWVAAASFFWGPPNRVPEIIRIPALLPIPVLTPIVMMLYWLWRMRGRKSVRGIVTASPIATERNIEVMS